MASFEGITHSAPIVPENENSKYPTHFSVLGAGGYYEVENISERNSIPIESFLHEDGMGSGRRRVGMLVYVLSENQTYRLVIDNYNSLDDDNTKLIALNDNSNWKIYKTGVYAEYPIEINDPNSEYEINHNLNLYPDFKVLEENETSVAPEPTYIEMFCSINHISKNSTKFIFLYPFKGIITMSAPMKNV